MGMTGLEPGWERGEESCYFYLVLLLRGCVTPIPPTPVTQALKKSVTNRVKAVLGRVLLKVILSLSFTVHTSYCLATCLVP